MDSDEQRTLDELEANLRRADPAMARRFALHSADTSIGWGALGASAVLLIGAAVVLVAGVHWGSAVLVVVAVAVFLLAGLPLSGLVTPHRHWRETDPHHDTAGDDS